MSEDISICKEITLLSLAAVFQSFQCCPIPSLPDELYCFIERCASIVVHDKSTTYYGKLVMSKNSKRLQIM
jgi:hypothetical protein